MTHEWATTQHTVIIENTTNLTNMTNKTNKSNIANITNTWNTSQAQQNYNKEFHEISPSYKVLL